jgi:hypothetical protein
MWSKKWYLKRNISCDAHLVNELLETDVPWDDAIEVLAGKLRKLWDSLSEVRSSLCGRRLERTILRPALLPVKTAQFTQFFRQVWRHTVKSLILTESVKGALERKLDWTLWLCSDRCPRLQNFTLEICCLKTLSCGQFLFPVFHCSHDREHWKMYWYLVVIVASLFISHDCYTAVPVSRYNCGLLFNLHF